MYKNSIFTGLVLTYGLTSILQAATIADFNTSGDTQIGVAPGGQQNSNIAQVANLGVINSGALQWSATGAAGLDHRYFGLAPAGATQTVDATQATILISSIKMRYDELDDLSANVKGKAQIRLGFIGDTAFTDPTKPQDAWKQNPGMHTDFKIEWNNNGAQPKISIETKFYPTTGAGGTELKATKYENAFIGTSNTPLQNATSLTGWYEVELVVERVPSTNEYIISSSLYDIGADGLAPRSLLGTSNNFTSVPTSALFASDTQVYPVLFLEGEKNLAEGAVGSRFVVDDWQITITQIPEPSLASCLGMAAVVLLRRRKRVC